MADGRVAGLRGDPDHPVTGGRLCAKARFQLDRHRSPERLTRPLVRAGDRLSPTDWPSALDLVAERLLEARARYGSLSVLHYWFSGSMGLLKHLYQRLFNLFGGVTEPSGGLCWSAGLAAQQADFGRVLSHDPADLDHAQAIVIWGRNPCDTNPHLVPFIERAKRREVPVVVIDPIATETARRLGNRHLAPRPGMDALLALALAGELIRNGSFDERFCLERAAGFQQFRETVTALELSRAAEHCCLPRADLVALARLLGERRPVAFIIGYGPQRHRWGGEAVRAIDALAAVSGSIGVSGGGANYANRHAEGRLRDLDARDRAAARRTFPMPTLGRRAPELADPPVRVFFCDRANPAAQSPDTGRVLRALRGLDFRVVADMVLTDTGALADVVLPVADFLEDEDLYYCSWHSHLTWATPAVEPPGEARSETWIVAELARRLGLEAEFQRTAAEWVAYALEPLVSTHPELAPNGQVTALRGTTFVNPAATAVPWQEGAFATASGRFEFGSTWRSLEGLSGQAAAVAPGVGEGRPLFHLLSPRHRLSLHSQFYGEVLRRTSRGTDLAALHIHPQAAGELGFRDGDQVAAVSASGRLPVHLVFDPGLRPDTVVIYGGGGTGLLGGPPASANFLIADDLTDLGGQAAYYNCLVALER